MGLSRSLNPIRHLQFIGKFMKSIWQVRSLVKEFRPDVAVGTGGYISFPLIFMAHCMGVKTAVHDSNARIGLANKVCGRFADLFMLGLPVPDKIKNSQLTSTPIRSEFETPADRQALLTGLGLDPAKKTVLVVGGSQGARALNAAVVTLAKNNPSWQFIHITGERWYGMLHEEYRALERVAVLPYSHEIYALMQAVDLVICRSGASTLAELIYCKLPAILVPFPYATADHQYYNAKILEDAGCARIVRENGELATRLQQILEDLSTGDAALLDKWRKAYASLKIPNPLKAAGKIAELLRNLS